MLRLLAGTTTVVLAAAGTAFLLIDRIDAGMHAKSPLLIVLIVVISAAYLGGMLFYHRYRKQKHRETRAFEEVMSMVHEVFEASKIHMSALELAEAKIRI